MRDAVRSAMVSRSSKLPPLGEEVFRAAKKTWMGSLLGTRSWAGCVLKKRWVRNVAAASRQAFEGPPDSSERRYSRRRLVSATPDTSRGARGVFSWRWRR